MSGPEISGLTGTLSTFGTDKGSFRYHEINSQVEQIAHPYFRHLENSMAATEAILGDARIRGFDYLAKVVTGIKFKDGVEVTQVNQVAA